ncbi:TolC family protein [Alteromonadaceae bacterium BrNp21-10]|nr:TolC family protein [Alteromonadaceae bacterium BrNp21-10]
MKYLYFVAVCILGLMMSSLTFAATTTKLTLRQALTLTQNNHPTLQQLPYRQRMVEGQVLQASIRPNPVVALELENLLGSGESAGVKHAEATLSFSQLIELGDKRQWRIAAASAEQRQLEAEFTYQQIDILAQTTERFYRAVQLQQLYQWSVQQQARLDNALRIAKERIAAGANSTSEVTRIRLQQARFQADTNELQGKLQEAYANLSNMWLAEPDFDGVNGLFQNLAKLPTAAAVDSAINQAPEFLRLLDSERSLDAKARALATASNADITVGLGLRYNNEFDDAGLVAKVSMPLLLSDPNQGHAQSMQAERDLLIDQQRLVRVQLRTLANTILERLKTNQSYLQAITSELLPLATMLVKEINAGYSRGSYSLLQVLDAQNELARLEYDQINRLYAIYSDVLMLERTTGQSFLEDPQ